MLRKKCWSLVAVSLVVLMCVCFFFYGSLDTFPMWTLEERHSGRMLAAVHEVSSVFSTQPAREPSKVSFPRVLSTETPFQATGSTATLRRASGVAIARNNAVAQTAVSTSSPHSDAASSTAPAATTPASSRGEKRTFIITHSFGGQLTRAVKNMMMQQCWARSLTRAATITEPFSHESLLLHTREIWDSVRRGQTSDVARFSDFFDLKLYNRASMEDGSVPLVTWEEFLLRAPRQAIVVSTPHASCPLIVNQHIQDVVDGYFEDFLSGLQFLNFKIVKIVPINCYDRNRGQKLMDVLSKFLQNYTLVFSSWRNYNVAKSWLPVSPHCDISDKYPATRLQASSMLRRHTHNYRSEVLRADKTIAIMLRVERFLTLQSSGRTYDETVDSCLDKTMAVYSDLREQPQWTSSQPFLTMDIGRYGSGIMQSNETVLKFNTSLEAVTESVTELLVKVYSGRWHSIGEWENSFLEATGGRGERGYVAMLQREIAVHSDCLILMGGGSFQEVAATHYLQAHPDPAHQCLHIVCAATALTTSLGKTGWKNKQPRMGQRKHHYH